MGGAECWGPRKTWPPPQSLTCVLHINKWWRAPACLTQCSVWLISLSSIDYFGRATAVSTCYIRFAIIDHCHCHRVRYGCLVKLCVCELGASIRWPIDLCYCLRCWALTTPLRINSATVYWWVYSYDFRYLDDDDSDSFQCISYSVFFRKYYHIHWLLGFIFLPKNTKFR